MNRNRAVFPSKAAKAGYILLSSLLCALGSALIAAPDTSMVWLEWASGVCVILYGVSKLAGYFSRDIFRLAFQYELAPGIFLMALGAITLARPEFTIAFLCAMLGIPLLADGVLNLCAAIHTIKIIEHQRPDAEAFL